MIGRVLKLFNETSMSLFQTLNRWKERKRTEGRIIKKKKKKRK